MEQARPGAARPMATGRLLGAAAFDFVLAVVVMVAVLAIAFAVMPAATSADGMADPGDHGIGVMVALALSLLAGAMTPYLLRRRASPAEVAKANAALSRAATWGCTGLAVVAMYVVCLPLDWLEAWSGRPVEAANEAMIMAMWAASPWLAWLDIVLLAPLFEEILFRRVLFGRFLQAGRPWLGLVLTSAAFASLHEFPGLSQGTWLEGGLLWLIYFASGAILACAYWRTASLWAPILAHMASNAIALWAMAVA